MATDKNITMKQFNGTDYDTLYPKTIASQIPDVYSKTETLTADTLSKYGLTFDKFPNDVFQQIKTLIDNVQASADGKARIQTGSYVGTGTYGASNPCSLTFDFEPILVFVSGTQPPITGGGTFGGGLFSPSSLSASYANFGYIFCSASSCACEYSNTAKIDGYTLYWYHAQNYGNNQLNLNGITYYYVAIG